jgi:type II secretory pathway pseudopilin PulG
MTLGVALFLIFVLYLIDKHNLWRLTAKIAAGLAVLAIVAAGGLYAWVKYQDYRTEKREAEQIAAHKAKVEACVARLTAQERSTKAVHTVPIPPGAVIGGPQYLDDNGNPIPQPPGHYLIRAACEADPSVTVTEPVPPPGYILDNQQTSPVTLDFSKAVPLKGSKLRRVRALQDADLTTQAYGSLTCGHVKAGESLTLLADEGTVIRVRTVGGQVGWSAAMYFESINSH